MKRQELRVCFDRIQPREDLIRSTLDRVHDLQENRRPARVMPTYAFATRLVSAACALLLVIGFGVSIGRDYWVSQDAVAAREGGSEPMISELVEEGGAAAQPDATSALVGCEQMIERAQAYEDGWAVLTATIDSVYFLSETDGTVAMRPGTLADGVWMGEPIDSTSDAWKSIVANFNSGDAAMMMLVDQMGSEVLIGMHAELRDGETAWVIHEVYAQEQPAE